MRWTTVAVLAVVAAGCSDLREFRGDWSGPRVGEAPIVKIGVRDGAYARLTIDDIDAHGLHARFSIDGLVSDGLV